MYEYELAAVLYCFLEWQHYIDGCQSRVIGITNHQTLTHLLEQTVLFWVEACWFIRLGLFQSIRPTIRYQLGKSNIVVDALSKSQRGSLDANAKDQGLWLGTRNNEDAIFALRGIKVTVQPSKLREWKQAYGDDPKL